MSYFSSITSILTIFFLFTGVCNVDAKQKLPFEDGHYIVAKVNGAPITLEELNNAIAASHTDMAGKMTAGRIDFSSVMERLIDSRLIATEGENMGLSELPESIKQLDQYSKQTLMEILLETKVKDITVDDAEVDELYKKAVKEWKLIAYYFWAL